MHSGSIGVCPTQSRAFAGIALLSASLLTLSLPFAGCQSARPLPPADLDAQGWEIKQGQAVWRPDRHKPELAGELLLGIRPNGDSFVQFTKTPFPLVTAKKTSISWEASFGPEGLRFSGNGPAPARIIWLRLDDILFRGAPPPRRWSLQLSGENWRLEHSSTGEILEGYFEH
jgi:hypothetical protein